MFRTRLLSGIVLVLAVFLVISQGGILLYGVLALVSLIGMREFYKAMQVSQVSENGMGILELAGYVGALLYEAALWSGIQKFGLAAVLAALALLMSVYVFTYPKYQAGQVMATFFWDGLCDGHALLHLPDTPAGGRFLPRVADLPVLLGM